MRKNEQKTYYQTELVQQVAKLTGVTHKHARKAVNATLTTIIEKVAEGNLVKLRGFGNFEPRRIAGRVARDINKGEPIYVEPRTRPVFVAADPFKMKVDSSVSAEND